MWEKENTWMNNNINNTTYKPNIRMASLLKNIKILVKMVSV
eukprot:UN07841